MAAVRITSRQMQEDLGAFKSEFGWAPGPHIPADTGDDLEGARVKPSGMPRSHPAYFLNGIGSCDFAGAGACAIGMAIFGA